MKHAFATAGERLASLIHDEHLGGPVWDNLESCLAITGRQTYYARYFRELSAVSVACRLVAFASSLSKRGNDGEPLDLDNPLFKARLSTYIRVCLGVVDKRLHDKLYRFVEYATKASQENISGKLDNTIKSTAKREHQRCYLCNVVLVHGAKQSPAHITIDHIWPRCFGGGSDEANLLPACTTCNSEKKQNFAAWSMVAIHSVALGWNPSSHCRTSIEGTIRFARHHLVVWLAASESKCSLQEAYLKVGPWSEELQVDDLDNDADFFNLSSDRQWR